MESCAALLEDGDAASVRLIIQPQLDDLEQLQTDGPDAEAARDLAIEELRRYQLQRSPDQPRLMFYTAYMPSVRPLETSQSSKPNLKRLHLRMLLPRL